MVGTILPRIQHAELGKSPKGKSSVKLHLRPLRLRKRSQGEMFVIGLVGGGAAAEKLLRRVEILGLVVGVVVLDIVVVPSADEWERRMRRL